MPHKTPARYYVYELIDPRDGECFYVGKGKGRRAWRHMREWMRGIGVNIRKLDRIADIHAAGAQVEVRIVADGMSEEQAYKLERETIARRRAALTNVASGQFSRPQLSAAHANDMLRRAMRPDAWARSFAQTKGREPTEDEIQLYAFVLRKLALNRKMIEAAMAKT
jgi:hypothetical protein